MTKKNLLDLVKGKIEAKGADLINLNYVRTFFFSIIIFLLLNKIFTSFSILIYVYYLLYNFR
ncbi:MAG: hypothetical protein E6Z63_03395 [Fusobacterium periodonticum]|nr:hypothetical protein [Fusobacterium periodonticum]